MRSLRLLAASGLSNLPDYLTLLPDESDHPSRRVCSEHRRVLCLEPDDKKSLINAEYSGHRRVRRVYGRGKPPARSGVHNT
jgi:hypothetical protein